LLKRFEWYQRVDTNGVDKDIELTLTKILDRKVGGAREEKRKKTGETKVLFIWS